MPVHQRRKIYGSVFSAALAVGLLIQFMPFLLYAFFDQYVILELGITAIYALALLIPAAVWYCFAKNDMPSLDKNRLKYPPAAIFISLGVITVAAYVNYFAVVPFSASGIFVNTESSPVIESVFYAVNFAVRSVIIAPICEEIFFRGFVLRRLSPLGSRRALIISSLIFSMFHTNAAQFIYTFVAGALFGWITLMTGKIRHAIIIHMINNGISVGATLLSLYYSPQSVGIAYSRVDFLLIFAAVISAVFIFIRKMSDSSLYSVKNAPPEHDGRYAVSVSMILYIVFTVSITALINLSIFN